MRNGRQEVDACNLPWEALLFRLEAGSLSSFWPEDFSGTVSSMHPRFLLVALSLLLPYVSRPGFSAESYRLGPRSLERGSGIPHGRVESFEFRDSRVYQDSVHQGWVYVPHQYDGSRPAALMVFQDGRSYVNESGDFRAPVVFDNLIASGSMPVTVAIFVNPGQRRDAGEGRGSSLRSFQYDSLGGAYASFLIDELIPYVVKTFSLSISADPAMRAIAGMSSGGICAWTVAWERPDQFGKVMSHIGSFVNIRGGHAYPALIRKTERKGIRVFLQDGRNDLNNLHGNWPLANQEMASALAFSGYDHRFVLGEGGHSGKHGGAIFPESLEWLWRPILEQLPKPETRDNLAGDEALSKVLPDGGNPGDWERVGEGYGFTDAACSDAEGNFYFADLPRGRIYQVSRDGGAPRVWLENGLKVSGMKFGPEGRLYACVQGTGTNQVKRVVVIDPETREVETLATQVQPNDLVVSKAGYLFFTDTSAGQVIRVPLDARGLARPPAVAGGILGPNGLTLSPDERQLWVSEYRGSNVWNFVVAEDGTLRGGERLAELRVPLERNDSGGDGATTDREGRVYVTSHLGIQVFDSTGRLGGVMARPEGRGGVSCAFAGPDHSWLYLCSGDRVFRRRTLTAAAGR